MGQNGMVAVIGRPNVGKSTLVNRLLGEKISIVTPIAQTTRNMIRGVLTESRGQLVFLDTPGLHRARTDLGRIMNKSAYAAMEGVDVVMLMLDSSIQPDAEDEGCMRRMAQQDEAQPFLVLNKVDAGDAYAGDYRQRWERIVAERAPARPAAWFALSALKGDGVDLLLQALFDAMPHGPQLFPEDVLTDFPRKLAMADVIREKVIRDLRQELPHAIGVQVNEIREHEEAWDVEVFIYVNKHSQKGIVIGHKGRRLRATRRAAERELSEVYEVPVRLSFRVKVEKDWSRNFWLLKQMGYAE